MKIDSVVLRRVCRVGRIATVFFATASAAWAYDAEYTADQSVTISAAGSYLVTGAGAGTVTIAANLSDVELTIRDVVWTNTTTQIDIGAGSSLALVLDGSSSIYLKGVSVPAVSLPQTSSLTVSGTGELDIQTYGAPCIGAAENTTMGSLTVNSGTITAQSGGSGLQGLAAAIGGGYSYNGVGGNGGTVIVNGGKLVAIGCSNTPGIGGGNTYIVSAHQRPDFHEGADFAWS